MRALRIVGLVVAIGCATTLAQPPVSDPDWTPRPAVGKSEPWERAVEQNWVDARFRSMDTGPTFDGTFAVPFGTLRQTVYKGVAIRVGERGEAGWLFDRSQMRWAGAWAGGFLKHSDRRFGLMNTPTPAGSAIGVTATGPGWADQSGGWQSPTAPTTALPPDWAKYRGLYLHGQRTVVAYTIGTTEVLESPWVETANGETALTREITVGPSDKSLRAVVGTPPFHGPWVPQTVEVLPIAVSAESLGQSAAVAVIGGDGRVTLRATEARLELEVAPHDQPLRCKLFLWRGATGNLTAFARLVRNARPPADVRKWTKPGPGRWASRASKPGVSTRATGTSTSSASTAGRPQPRATAACSGSATRAGRS